MIDEILAPDRSYLGPYVLEVGGGKISYARSEDEVEMIPMTTPVGSSKIPTAGRATNGGAMKRGVVTGSEAVKKVKVEDLVTQHEARMKFDKEKFKYEKERDERWMKFVEKEEIDIRRRYNVCGCFS